MHHMTCAGLSPVDLIISAGMPDCRVSFAGDIRIYAEYPYDFPMPQLANCKSGILRVGDEQPVSQATTIRKRLTIAPCVPPLPTLNCSLAAKGKESSGDGDSIFLSITNDGNYEQFFDGHRRKPFHE